MSLTVTLATTRRILAQLRRDQGPGELATGLRGLDRLSLQPLRQAFGDRAADLAHDDRVGDRQHRLAQRQARDRGRRVSVAARRCGAGALVEAGHAVTAGSGSGTSWTSRSTTERAERIRRLVADRGMSEQDAVRRIGAQADDEQRRAVADVVIDNNGTRDELLQRVDALWSDLRAR